MPQRWLTARPTRVCGVSARSTRDTVVLPQEARQVGVPGRVGEPARAHRLSQHRAIDVAPIATAVRASAPATAAVVEFAAAATVVADAAVRTATAAARITPPPLPAWL